MARVRISARARDYLVKEAKYLRDHNQAAAGTFVAKMQHARQLLADFPKLAPNKRGLPVHGMHCLVVGDYLVDYQIRGDEVLILAIRHGRQAEISIETDQAGYDDDDGS